jgi:PhnB protein
MPNRLNPYITFPGNARAAMEHYEKVFGGTLTVATFGDYGAPEGVDPSGVMHAMLETPSGFTLMASDLAPGDEHKPGDNFSVSLSGDGADELRGYFEKLSAGGSVVTPLEKQMWGDEFGMCLDQFDIRWLVNIGQPQG